MDGRVARSGIVRFSAARFYVSAPPPSIRRQVFTCVALLVVALAAWTFRVVWGGEAELRRSDDALERGEVEEAVVHARRAASFYAPWAPHVSDAYRRMIALATAAEEHHRRDTATFAWRSVRQAALDTRWLMAPHAPDCERAEREVARLSALGVHENVSPDPLIESRQLALLRHDDRPRVGWTLVLLLGMLTAGAGIFFASDAVAGSAGRLDLRQGKRPLLVAAVGVLAWLLAWWQA